MVDISIYLCLLMDHPRQSQGELMNHLVPQVKPIHVCSYLSGMKHITENLALSSLI